MWLTECVAYQRSKYKDEPEDNDTDELYQLFFIKTEETCPIAR